MALDAQGRLEKRVHTCIPEGTDREQVAREISTRGFDSVVHQQSGTRYVAIGVVENNLDGLRAVLKDIGTKLGVELVLREDAN